jgi:predicted small integral membrane protein
MRWRDGFGPKQLVTLCVLGSLLYFSHAVGFFMAAFFIGVVALLFGLAEWHYRAENGDTRSGHTISVLLKRVLVPQLAFLPCLVLFFVSSIGSQPETNPVTRTFSQRLMVFRELYVLVDTRGALGILRVCLVGSFLLWGFYLAIVNAVKQLVACDGLGILAATCLSLYIVLPWSISGGGMIPERMAWFGLCGALLWMGSKEWTIKARQAVIGVSTLVVVLG